MASRDMSRSQSLAVLILLPMWMNFLLRTYAMMTLFENNGVLNTLFEALGLPRQQMIGTEGAVLVGMVYNFLPFMVLPIYTVLKKLDPRVIEAAEDLGANPVRVVTRVVLPMSVPGIVSGITMVFMPAVTTFAISRLMSLRHDLPDGRHDRGVLHHHEQPQCRQRHVAGDDGADPDLHRLFAQGGPRGSGRWPMVRKSRGAVKAFKWTYLALVLAFLYVPIAVMIALSFNASVSRAEWTGFTFDWYAKLFESDAILAALEVTIEVALAATAVSTVLGTLGAIGMHAMKKGWASLLLNLSYLPMTTPDIVTGVSLMLMFIFMKIPLGKGTMLMAHIAFDTPYVLFAVMPRLKQMNPNLYEAALDLGCHPLKALYKVILPEILPGVVTGALLAFTMSLDDFVISYFTSSTDQNLSMVVYSAARRGVEPTMYALSTLMFLVILALLLIVNRRSSLEKM